MLNKKKLPLKKRVLSSSVYIFVFNISNWRGEWTYIRGHNCGTFTVTLLNTDLSFLSPYQRMFECEFDAGFERACKR